MELLFILLVLAGIAGVFFFLSPRRMRRRREDGDDGGAPAISAATWDRRPTQADAQDGGDGDD